MTRQYGCGVAELREPAKEPPQGYNSVMSVVFSPDCKRLVSGSTDKTIRIWDVETRMPVGNATSRTHTEIGSGLSHSRLMAKRLVSGSDGQDNSDFGT